MGMDFERGRGRGRGFSRGGDRGGSRGRGGFGDRGGGRGGSRGFSRGGGDRGGSFTRGGGDRGGSFSRGGGGFDRGASRGFARGGGDQGSRGRGNFRGSDRGGRGAARGGRGGLGKGNSKQDGEIMIKEIHDGLQLYVIYKKVPNLEETKKTLKGVHSRISRPMKEGGGEGHMILFTSLEALEAAKVILEKDANVTSVDYMGIRSAKKQTDNAETRQLFLRFTEAIDEEKVKALDSKIESVNILKDGASALATYSSHANAIAAVKVMGGKIGTNNLTFVKEGFGVKFLTQVASGTVKNKVVLRDVPKTATIKDAAKLFPDATTFILYDATFPASQYCHASLHFPDPKRVDEVLKMKNLEMVGKKIFPVPAHKSLLTNFPDLGKEELKEVTKAAINLLKESEPKAKKMKMEVTGSDDEEGSEEEDEESEDEGDEEASDEEAEDEENGADDDEEDDDDDDSDE